MLTIWAVIVFAFLMIPFTDHHRNGIRAKRHHIPDRVLLDEMVRERVRVKVFPQIIPDHLESRSSRHASLVWSESGAYALREPV